MELQVPIPTIDLAVAMRDLSMFEEEREQASAIISDPCGTSQATATLPYATGRAASCRDDYHLRTKGMALLWWHRTITSITSISKPWRGSGGALHYRAALLEDICAAFHARRDLPKLCCSSKLVAQADGSIRRFAPDGMPSGQVRGTGPGLMVSLGYLDAYRSAWLPANLTQAQRDYFGAHTYERVDAKGAFHTQWETE